MVDETDLAARLVRLEAEVRRGRRVAAIAAVIAIAALGFGVRTLRTPNRLEIDGDDGAQLELRGDSLAFVDGKGQFVAKLSAENHWGQLDLKGADAWVHLAATTMANIDLTQGNKRVALSANQHFSELTLMHGASFASLRTADTLDALLSLSGGEHQGMVALTNGGKDLNPRLQLSKDPPTAVVLEAASKGSTIQISDLSGFRTLMATQDIKTAASIAE
jgi:hypothetical protein